MTEKPEVQKPVALDLFLPQNVVARLDNWRRRQPHSLSREDAVLALVAEALANQPED